MIPYGMKQDDARKLDHATLEAIRIRAVRSVQAGENPEVVARSYVKISRRTIYGWLAQYQRGGRDVESQAVVWKAAQTECTSYAMSLQDCDREESIAAEVCVRAVDAGHGGQTGRG
jgi:transposase